MHETETNDGFRTLMVCQSAGCEAHCDITAAGYNPQRDAELLIAAGWDGAEEFWCCPAHKHLLDQRGGRKEGAVS